MKKSLRLVQFAQLTDLLTDLRAGCSKKSRTAITADIARTTTVFHIGFMYRRYNVKNYFNDKDCEAPAKIFSVSWSAPS